MTILCKYCFFNLSQKSEATFYFEGSLSGPLGVNFTYRGGKFMNHLLKSTF